MIIDSSSVDMSESDEPVPPPKTRRRSSQGERDSKRAKTESSSEPKKRKGSKEIKVKKEPVKEEKAKVKEEAKEEDKKEEESEEYKWWLEENKDGGVKWETLEHMGPLFPPKYEPHGVKLLYKGEPVDLTEECEEICSFYAAMIETDHAKNPTFQRNFFNDFLDSLKGTPAAKIIKKFEDCDFTLIFNHLNMLKEQRKQLSKEEKKKIKEEKAEIDQIYGFCVLDGRREKVGNYRIEPPGLFRGRGEHPKTGCLKRRVYPEQVTINIGKDAKIPDPPAGHKWGAVNHDNTVTWLAMWKDNVNDAFKYVFLAANSSLKGQSDFKKFEKARELKGKIAEIREAYTADLKDTVMATRQLATCLYFIDKLALRAGNEKGEDEADTVGCCSLRYEHITLERPNKVIFDFLGKDSIRYVNTVEVDPQVFKNLKIFKKPPKQEGDDLFDRINTTVVNKHLNKLMQGLTAKVFRTFNASFTFQDELKKTPENSTVAEKILAYNRANRQVAVLCNHQRAVPKSHGNQMARLRDKILAIKYERQQIKRQMMDLDSKLKKSKDFTDFESDLDDEFIERHQQSLALLEQEKREKALLKLNEKLVADGEKPVTELPDKKKQTTPPTLEKLEKKLVVLNDRLSSLKLQQVDKDENKQTALGTSKINYIDPRITAAWCDKYNVPLDKMFNKALREKFKWAMDTKKDFIW